MPRSSLPVTKRSTVGTVPVTGVGAAVLGGFSNFFGPIVGALTFTLLQDQLQSLTEYWRFVLGAILALIVIGFPEGIAGLAADLGRRIGWRTA